MCHADQQHKSRAVVLLQQDGKHWEHTACLVLFDGKIKAYPNRNPLSSTELVDVVSTRGEKLA